MAEDATKPPPQRAAVTRQDRLAKALRANLTRRKTQARQRGTDDSPEKPEKAD